MARKKKNKSKKNNELIKIDVIENNGDLATESNEELVNNEVKEEREKEIIVVKRVVRKHNIESQPQKSLKDKFNELDNTKKKILYGLIALLIMLLFVFVILPFIKESSAKTQYNNGKYEEAIHTLDNMHSRTNAAQIIRDSEKQIAIRSAEYLLANDSDLKTKNLSFVDVEDYKCSLDYRNRSEVSSFVAEYKNDNYTYKANYSVNNSKLNDGTWSVMDYSLVDSQIIPVIESNQTIADAIVLKDYPKAVFKNTNSVSSSQVEYVYELVSSERPLYKTGYMVIANCKYDPTVNLWKVNDVKKELIDSEQIPFSLVTTSIFKISVPETWYVTRNEDVNTWNGQDGSHTYYYYNYNFYSDKDFSSQALTISVNFSDTNTGNYMGGTNVITSKGIGNGTYSQYDSSTNVNFSPKIRNMNSNFNIYSYGITIEELQPIIDSIVMGNYNYKLSVIKGPINIRNDHSTKTGAIISKANVGNAFTSSRAMFNEGYTWFNIGENKWIADSNGEWLKID